MNVDKRLDINDLMPPNSNYSQKDFKTVNNNISEIPIYVFFEYENKRVSELIIPDKHSSFDELISKKSKTYNIDKDTFLDLVEKNKIPLSEILSDNKGNDVIINNNSADKNLHNVLSYNNDHDNHSNNLSNNYNKNIFLENKIKQKNNSGNNYDSIGNYNNNLSFHNDMNNCDNDYPNNININNNCFPSADEINQFPNVKDKNYKVNNIYNNNPTIHSNHFPNQNILSNKYAYIIQGNNIVAKNHTPFNNDPPQIDNCSGINKVNLHRSNTVTNLGYQQFEKKDIKTFNNFNSFNILNYANNKDDPVNENYDSKNFNNAIINNQKNNKEIIKHNANNVKGNINYNFQNNYIYNILNENEDKINKNIIPTETDDDSSTNKTNHNNFSNNNSTSFFYYKNKLNLNKNNKYDTNNMPNNDKTSTSNICEININHSYNQPFSYRSNLASNINHSSKNIQNITLEKSKSTKKMNIIRNLKSKENLHSIRFIEPSTNNYNNHNNYDNPDLCQNPNHSSFKASNRYFNNKENKQHLNCQKEEPSKGAFTEQCNVVQKSFPANSTSINEGIKNNLNVNYKYSQEISSGNLDNSNEKKINKIFNIKKNFCKSAREEKNKYNENKYFKKIQSSNFGKIEFLTEKEKEDLSMLFAYTTANKKYLADSEGKSNNLNTLNNNINSSSNNNNINNLKKLKKKKLDFSKIKAKTFKENSVNIDINNSISNTINLNSNINNDNTLNFLTAKSKKNFFDVDSLNNTDYEIRNRQRLISAKASSLKSANLFFKSRTRKNFKSTFKYSSLFSTAHGQSISFHPRINDNSIFMSLRAKYSKLLKLESENNSQTNNNLNNNSNSNLESKKISKYSHYHKESLNNRKNKMDYISKTDISDNELSKTVYRSQEEVSAISNRLHGYAARYNVHKKRMAEDFYSTVCPFTPSLINDVYKIYNIKPSIKNFFYRLQGWVDKRNLKYETDYENTFYDQKTGDRLFMPRINQNSRFLTQRSVWYLICYYLFYLS